MRAYSVTVTMTPRQAIEAAHALHEYALTSGNGRMYAASGRVTSGLWDAGWEAENVGDDDDPKWVWKHPA